MLLHGPSSAGKSSTSRALLPLLGPDWVHFDPDDSKIVPPALSISTPTLFNQGQFYFHSCALAVLHSGKNVVIEFALALFEPPQVREFLLRFQDVRVYLIAFQCPSAELERREQERGDRRIGLARRQIEEIAQSGTPLKYDLVLDSSCADAPERAKIIAEFVAGHPQPTAFASTLRGLESIRMVETIDTETKACGSL